MPSYTVTVATGSQWFAGTDDYIYLSLIGSVGCSEKHLLDKAFYNDFERGAVRMCARDQGLGWGGGTGGGGSGKEPAAGQGGQPSEDYIIRVPTERAAPEFVRVRTSGTLIMRHPRLPGGGNLLRNNGLPVGGGGRGSA